MYGDTVRVTKYSLSSIAIRPKKYAAIVQNSKYKLQPDSSGYAQALRQILTFTEFLDYIALRLGLHIGQPS
jgi:hypothetical protein